MFGKIKKLILDTVFKISPQPVLFSELMIANKQFNEGMHLKGINLGYRLTSWFISVLGSYWRRKNRTYQSISRIFI